MPCGAAYQPTSAGNRRRAGAGACCTDACGHHEADADDAHRAGVLMQHYQADDHREGGFECHQRAERGRGEPAQREKFKGERHDGSRIANPASDEQDFRSNSRQHRWTDRRGRKQAGDGPSKPPER